MFEKDKLVFKVDKMMCGHCVAHVEAALKGVSGVKSAKASLEDKTVSVVYSSQKTDSVELIKAIASAGYEAVVVDA